LLEEPWPAGWAAVVTGVDGFCRSCKWCAKEASVKDLEEDEEDRNANGGLKGWSVDKYFYVTE